ISPVQTISASDSIWALLDTGADTKLIGRISSNGKLETFPVPGVKLDAPFKLLHEWNGTLLLEDGYSIFKQNSKSFEKVLDYRKLPAEANPSGVLPYAYLKKEKNSRLLIEGDDDVIHISENGKWKTIAVLGKESFIRPSEEEWFEGKSVLVSPSGTLWLWTQEKIAEWQKNGWNVHEVKSSLPFDTYVNPLGFFDSQGRLWIPHRLEEAYSVFNPQDKSIRMVTFSPGILTEFSIHEDSAGNFWEASETGFKAIHVEEQRAPE
ncbi:MAG: hypothetical protein M3Q07_15595, partial [Pseudobdellovibrionaceae bacterium]|nr:hypothetical protein [Pseudobdellovibrionaceae bacterium]